MLKIKGSEDLRRIVVLNPKGGSGKTTLAFNLAVYVASAGHKVALVDMDRQESCIHWLRNRPPGLPAIHGISFTHTDPDASRDQYVDVPNDINYAVIDAPAGLAGHQLADYTCGAHAIIVPVLPSDIDIHAASRLIKELLLEAQVSRRNGRLGVIANRVNERTVAFKQLKRFLNRLSITIVGHLRDSQNYIWAASSGRGIHEMAPSRVSKDLAQWETVTQWLDERLATPLTRRDLLRPTPSTAQTTRRDPRTAILIRAAAVALLAISLGWWIAPRDTNTSTQVEPIVRTESVLTSSDELVDIELRDESLGQFQDEPQDESQVESQVESQIVRAGDELKQKWQLSGIATVDGTSTLILSDRSDNTTQYVSAGVDLDGWTIMDSGSNYAIFAQNGEQVRLDLDEESVN